LLCWAFASPVGSSPDDDYHLASIWCGLGDRPGDCSPTGSADAHVVPKGVADASACYAFHPEISAACQAGIEGAHSNDQVRTTRGNFTGDYPPLYYSTMSLLVTKDITLSVLLMRGLNIVIFVAMSVALFVLLPARRRSTLVVAWAVSVVPLGMFMLSSINPSAWAIISAGSLWIALLGYFESRGRRRAGLGIIAAVATVMGAGARADSALYAVLAIAAVVFLTAAKNRTYLIQLLLPVGLVVVAIGFYFSARQSSFASTGLGTSDSSLTGLNLVVHNLFQIPSLWAGVFGTWGLGWLDTTMPPVVWFGALFCFCAAIFAGLWSSSIRKSVVLGGALLVLVGLPVFVLQQSQATVGSEVQPRYLLPLLVMVAGIALIQVNRTPIMVNRTQITVGVAALAIANSVALYFNMKRYVLGANASGLNLGHGTGWWWGTPFPHPLVVWGLGSIAFAAALLLLSRWAVLPAALKGWRLPTATK
jgi:hypothetical protein